MFQSHFLARSSHSLFRGFSKISKLKTSLICSKIPAFTHQLHYSTTTPAKVGRVTLAIAKQMPRNYDEMPNDVLLSMAVMGDQEVCM